MNLGSELEAVSTHSAHLGLEYLFGKHFIFDVNVEEKVKFTFSVLSSNMLHLELSLHWETYRFGN